MPITLACPCGKPLRVADQFAGKLVKCPVCGATQRAGGPEAEKPAAPSAETFDDFDVVEDTSPAPMQLPPEPAPAAPPPSKPRLKAAVVADEPAPSAPAAPASAGITGKPKKKKKKKKAGAAAEGDDDWYEQMRENEAWMRRVLRGSAFLALGLIILAGVAIMYFGFREDVSWLQESGGNGKLGLLLLTVIGLAAVGKGVIGLVCGQFLGEDD